jgi:hypothetical protein
MRITGGPPGISNLRSVRLRTLVLLLTRQVTYTGCIC